MGDFAPFMEHETLASSFSRPLHGARGLFATMVFLFHVATSELPTFALARTGPGDFVLRSFSHGVDLFFGISGIVIFGALQRASGPGFFLIERATRIFPVLWAALLVFTGLLVVHSPAAVTPAVFVANMLALPPLIHVPQLLVPAWSLSFELSFYLFCAVAWQASRHLGPLARPLIAAVALAFLFFHLRGIMLAVGIGTAWLLARRPRLLDLARWPGLALVVFLLCWETLCRQQNHLTNWAVTDLRTPARYALVLGGVMAGAAGLAGILRGRGLFAAFLLSRPMQYLGTVSYSFYLWQLIVMGVVKRAMLVLHLDSRLGAASQLALLVLALPLSLLVAHISQHLLERRVTGYLRAKLEGRRRAAEPATSTL